MSSPNNEEEFDIRAEVSPEQFNEEEEKSELEQQKVIEHIKTQKELLQKENEKSITKSKLSKEFDENKMAFNLLSKKMTSLYEKIDEIHTLIDISIRKKNIKDIETYNNILDEERQNLRSVINELNSVYITSTTITADCISRILF